MGKSVAVIGASADRSKFGNKAVRAYASRGWRVFPVNGKGGEVEGVTAFRSLRDVTEKIDRVTLYLHPEAGVKILGDVAAARPEEFFVNPGAESDELMDEARRLGLDPILACSIVEIGVSPAHFSG